MSEEQERSDELGMMTESPSPSSRAGWRPSKRAVAALVLGVMALMALIGYLFAMSTVEQRRMNDTKRQGTSRPR